MSIMIGPLLERVYNKTDQAARKMLGDRGRDIFMGTNHTRLSDAVAADLVDVIPLAGDFSNVLRIQDAARRGGEFSKRRLPVQLVDFIGGALPDPIGGIIDLLTPTNTLGYLESKGISPEDLPAMLMNRLMAK